MRGAVGCLEVGRRSMVEVIDFGVVSVAEVGLDVLIVLFPRIAPMKAGEHVSHFRPEPPRLVIRLAFDNLRHSLHLHARRGDVHHRRQLFMLECEVTFIASVGWQPLARLLVMLRACVRLHQLEINFL